MSLAQGNNTPNRTELLNRLNFYVYEYILETRHDACTMYTLFLKAINRVALQSAQCAAVARHGTRNKQVFSCRVFFFCVLPQFLNIAFYFLFFVIYLLSYFKKSFIYNLQPTIHNGV